MRTYWTRTLQARISRRRALAATGAGALGAAFLAACGGDDDNGGNGSSDSGEKNPLIGEPVDASQAKAGGTLKAYGFLDPIQGLDPLLANHRVTQNEATFTYSRLLQNTTAKYPKLAEQTVEGDVCEKYELSPDKLTLTLKLRPGIKWDSRAPTNGRALDVQDLLFTFNRFAASHPNRGELMYNTTNAKTAPIESVTSPDSSTIVLKLKGPDASLLPMLGSDSYIYVMPRESEGGFNSKTEMRGSGPWMLDEYVPSVRLTWSRNPNYYAKDRPYPNKIEKPIIPEYAQRLAQFRAGNILVSIATPDDTVQTKRDLPGTLLLQNPGYPAIGGQWMIVFGYDGDSPWKDVRMRRALSMTMNRQLFGDTINNADKYTSQGFPVDTARNTMILPGWTGHWLDPQGKDFGSNAKYLEYNLQEAKSLMSAAGNASGVKFSIACSVSHPPPAPQLRELWAGMFKEGGFDPQLQLLPEAEWFSNYYFAYGPRDASGKAKGFNGTSMIVDRSGPTVPALLYAALSPNSGTYHGATPDGSNVEKGDPTLNDLIDKMRVEFDITKQQSLAHDVQRRVAEQVYMIPNASSIKTYQLIWPALANAGVYSIFGATDPTPVAAGSSWREQCLYWWIDSTKPPFTS